MKTGALAAAALLMLAPSAMAQTGKDEQGDWWLFTSKNPNPDQLILVDGAARRTGGVATMTTYMIYREPGDGGIVAVRVETAIDCAAKSRSGTLRRIYRQNGTVDDVDSAFDPQPVSETNILYTYACNGETSGLIHYGNRPRSQVAAQAFAANPKP